MTLDDLLAQFESPIEAAELGGLGRTASYHWFAKGDKRILPSMRVIIIWANHFGLSNEQLGSVLRDRDRLRSEINEMLLEKRKDKEKRETKEALSRRREILKKRSNERKNKFQERKDEKIERNFDIEQKEQFLYEQEKQKKLANMVRMLEDNINGPN